MRKGLDFTGIALVFTCHDGNNGYLLSKRTDQCRDEHGCWDPGGGGLKFGEQVEDALRREIKEEYCAEIEEYIFLGYRDVHREHEGEKTHWVTLDYKVKINPTQAAIGEPHKCAELGWFTLDNLPAPLHSQYPIFLKKYKDML